MTAMMNGCCVPTEDARACCGVPPEFVRMRFYFGQRLGPIELSDLQGYLAGKHAFHNMRAHGAGILCGLALERSVFPQGAPPATPTTVLRVHRGAALDGCGHDIIVGWDQCIDVAAWFAKNQAKIPELADWKTGKVPARLWVALRYRECPSDPAPAPRDPCGCDAGGCEYGRVREGFELALFSDAARPAFAQSVFPPAASLAAAVASAHDRATLDRALKDAADHDCPPPPEDPWLAVGVLRLVLDTSVPNQPRVVDLADLDDEVPERELLLSTAALQELVSGLAVASAEAGVVGAGPTWGAVAVASTAADQGTITIPLALAADNTPLAPFVASQLKIAMSSFDPLTGWASVTPSSMTLDTSDPLHPTLVIVFTAGLAEGRYRVILDQVDPTAPLADQLMRAVTPTLLQRQFRLQHQGGVPTNPLELAPTLF
jgi:hypothetical protein